LENVGVEISPIRLLRRIKNGLEIPGLKEALIKILQDFHLQISLLEGCGAILAGDCTDLTGRLQKGQGSGFLLTGMYPPLFWVCVLNCPIAKTECPICNRPMQGNLRGLVILFLCRHVVHLSCVRGRDIGEGESSSLMRSLESYLGESGFTSGGRTGISGSVAL